MNGFKKTLSIMLCVAMIASGSFMAFAEGENTQPSDNAIVVEGENPENKEDTENGTGTEGENAGTEGENKEENKDEDKQQSEALLAATGALDNLPLFDSLTEDTDADALLAQVQAARKAYDALTEEEKLLVEEAKLNNLLDLEFFFENRPSNTPADAPVDQVVATQTETETADLTGEGTQASPYEIKSVDDFNSALENGADDIYVKLVDNITGAITVESGTSVVLDLNGKTISSNDNTVTVKGTMVIKDEQAGQPSVSDDYKTVSYTAGKIISSKNDGSGVSVQEGGNLTLESGIVESTSNIGIGVHGSEKPESWNTPIESSVTVTGGLVKAQEFGIGVYGNGAKLTVSGGVVTTVDNAAVAGNGRCDNTTNFGGTTINIEGGTLIGNIKTAGYIANGIYHPQAGVCNISGGTIVANNGVGILMRNGELNVTGNPEVISTGTAKGKVGDNKCQVDSQAVVLHHVYGDTNSETGRAVSIEGGQFVSEEGQKAISVSSDGVQIKNFIKRGSFSSPVDKEHLDESLKAGLYSPSANPDAPYSYYTSVEEAKAAAQNDPDAVITDVTTGNEEALYPAAKIGNTTYNTLEEALKAAKSGDTIVLQKDVSTSAITLPAGVTLDGGNHVITCNTEIANGAFITATGDNVTIKNATVNVDGKAKHGIQFYCVKGGKLENVNVMGGKYTAVIVNGAEVSINGGNLSTNGYAVVEYAMGKNVTTVPKLTMNNVTPPNTDKPLVYMDKATIDRIKDNTKELGQNATTEQVIEHLKKDNLTGNNIKDMQVGENGMIIVPAPSTPVDPPVVPEKPNSNSGSTGSSSTVQQMEEREKPDPADKKAMEEYNFWMQVKSKIRATAEGKTLRITVKEGIEYMPASVMQTLYECKVGITLYWDGVTIEIPVGKAQPKQALRVYWTKTKLMDLYNA